LLAGESIWTSWAWRVSTLFQSTPAIAGGRIPFVSKALSAFDSFVHFREPSNEDVRLQIRSLQKIKRPFKTMGCEVREPLGKKAITWGSRL
jgi:hypothetical protein